MLIGITGDVITSDLIVGDGDMIAGSMLRRWRRNVMIGRWRDNRGSALLAEFSVGPAYKSTFETLCALHFCSL
jgi:hypothetical protein